MTKCKFNNIFVTSDTTDVANKFCMLHIHCTILINFVSFFVTWQMPAAKNTPQMFAVFHAVFVFFADI